VYDSVVQPNQFVSAHGQQASTNRDFLPTPILKYSIRLTGASRQPLFSIFLADVSIYLSIYLYGYVTWIDNGSANFDEIWQMESSYALALEKIASSPIACVTYCTFLRDTGAALPV